MRIVIADDQGITRGVLAGYLRKLGHDVVAVCANGKDAIDLCREHLPDLVTLDWAMTQINGDEAARIIRAQNLATHILFITSQGQSVVQRVARDVNAKAIIKPFRDQQLGAVIEEIIRESNHGPDGTDECDRHSAQ